MPVAKVVLAVEDEPGSSKSGSFAMKEGTRALDERALSSFPSRKRSSSSPPWTELTIELQLSMKFANPCGDLSLSYMYEASLISFKEAIERGADNDFVGTC